MTKTKFAIGFIVVILVALGYCGLAGPEGKWGVVALFLFVAGLAGLFLTGLIALFDWISGPKKE